MRLQYIDRGPHNDHNAWLILWLSKDSSIALRFGKPQYKLFSERNQGTKGIPKAYWYFFGGRLTLRIWRRQRRND